MYRMLKNATAALLLAAATLAGGFANAQLVARETAIETGTDEVTLPAAVGGSVTLRGCRSCQLVTISLASTTRFFVGRQQLSEDQFRSAVADGRIRSLTIMYDNETRAMTRVVLRAGSVRIGTR